MAVRPVAHAERDAGGCARPGWARVNGLRGDSALAKRIQYARYDIDYGSLRFDVRILAVTLFIFSVGAARSSRPMQERSREVSDRIAGCTARLQRTVTAHRGSKILMTAPAGLLHSDLALFAN